VASDEALASAVLIQRQLGKIMITEYMNRSGRRPCALDDGLDELPDEVLLAVAKNTDGNFLELSARQHGDRVGTGACGKMKEKFCLHSGLLSNWERK
jgi:hypothetical protein